nr:MAG TPA: hypothetical protein [Caudoviricetes sp.]
MGDTRDRPTPALPGPRLGPPSMTKAPHQPGGAPPSFAVSGREV